MEFSICQKKVIALGINFLMQVSKGNKLKNLGRITFNLTRHKRKKDGIKSLESSGCLEKHNLYDCLFQHVGGRLSIIQLNKYQAMTESSSKGNFITYHHNSHLTEEVFCFLFFVFVFVFNLFSFFHKICAIYI